MAGKSQFVTGNCNFKRETIMKLATPCHVTKSQPNKPGMVTAAFNRVESRSKEEEARQVKIKFNIAYLIAKEE